MSEALIKDAITAAVNAAPGVNTFKTDLTSTQISSIAANMPPPMAMESLWPQMLRYGIAIASAYLAGKGASLTDIAILQQYGEPVAFGLVALSMPAWRFARTIFVRNSAKAG